MTSKNSLIKAPLKATAAAGVLALAVAGGYVAHADGLNAGAVNAHPSPPPGASALPSFADIVERVAPAVVSIEVEGKIGPKQIADQLEGGEGGDASELPPELRRFFQQQGRQAQPQTLHAAGSGFFVSADGYIVTNNHVVENADKITIHTADDRTFKARVVKVEGANLPFVSFEDRAKPRVGDWVVAVGNPFNLGGTATAGIVSALGRKNVSDSSYVDYMQIDAPINRGNSGGPTFDLYGRVVGVNTAIFSPSGGSVGIGFDIPADVVARVSKELISTGKITRGYIGAQVQNVTPDIAESLGLTGKGALVAELTVGGPADRAGLKPGDLITKANGQPVESATDLTRAVGLVRAGDPIRLDVRREGQVRAVVIRSGTRPSEDQLAANTPKGGDHQDGDGGVTGALGLSVTPDPQGQGVRVAGVDAGSDAAQKGLRRGDVILQAGGRAAHAPADITAAVAEAKKAGRHQVLLFVARGAQHTFVPIEIGHG
jgi:serine protease Do